MKLLDKTKAIVAALLSLLFTVMQIVGYQISMVYGTTVHQSDFFQDMGVLSVKQCTMLGVVEFALGCIIIYFLFTLLERVKILERNNTRRGNFLLWLAAALMLFVCWIPCLRAMYPGCFNYDAMVQLPQALYEEVQYSAHHPLLHTLIMGKIITFGYTHGAELNDGIVLHSLFQMAVCAIAFAYMIYYILRITGRRWLAAVAFCYYAFFPPIAMFATSTTKDVIFSALFQLCVIFLYEMCKDMSAFFSTRWKILRFLVVVVLMCLFRKNGIYALVCVVPFVVIWGKAYWKRCLLLFGSIFVLYLVISKSFLVILDATEGSPEEMLSVPMQQIARVYCDYGEDAFEPEELAHIYEGILAEQILDYNPFLSDHIKNYFDYNVILDNTMDYVTMWFKKGLQYPKAYLKAFLENTYQAWYPGTSIYAEPYDEQTYYFDLTMYPSAYRDSQNPELLEFYVKIASGYYYQKLPVVRLLFSIGAMFWVALFTLSFAIYRKNKPLLIAMLLVVFLCVTIFMGPISLVRYYLVLFYGFPVSLGFLLQGVKKQQEEAVAFH